MKCIAFALACTTLLADHGPSTSGGGMGVQSGETLRAGKWALELRSDYTAFKVPSDPEIQAKAAAAGDIDLLGHSWLQTMSLAYGLTDTFQLSVSTGYYTASGGATVSDDQGVLSRSTNQPNGLTDLWVSGKWSFYTGPAGRFAAFAGVKLPTGKKDITDSNDDSVDFASTPGSGATDGQAGLGYSTFLTRRLTLDASASRTFRGTYRDYRLGTRTDAGVALAYRFREDTHVFPQVGAFLELNYREIGKVRAQGIDSDNSGGRALFASPGGRIAFHPGFALTVAVQLPLNQSPNGAQIETRFKAVAALSYSF